MKSKVQIIILLIMSTFAMAEQNGIAMINDVLDRKIKEDKIPGLQYTVLDDSNLIFEYSSGFRDLRKKDPVTSNTAFMLNSSTKVFTAAAILQLVEKGQVDLDHRLSKYYSDHPYSNEITIRHLLSQTSGIPNPLPLKWLHLKENHSKFDEKRALVNILADNASLSFPPGEKYGYSNIAYWLLGKVIEAVSGETYCDYLRHHVFDPLKITSSELGCTIPDDNTLAVGYQKKYSFFSIFLYFSGVSTFFSDTQDGYLAFKQIYHNGPSYGGLYGSGQGIAKFLSDMLSENPVVFGREMRDLFFTKQATSTGEPVAMTLGWRTGSINNISYFEKPGGGPGGHSNIRIYPDKKMATIFLINKTEVSESTISQRSNYLDSLFFSAYEGNAK
ncbi:MAG: beta-lactamase family protein [Gammaproteobacteria bacterium]|nr:beta-lactamase family protein [Gammaproteobacteria bacterium]